MKTIISQNGWQLFTFGFNSYVSIAIVEDRFSVGVNGMSAGMFDTEAKAVEVLMEIAEFLTGEKAKYKIP